MKDDYKDRNSKAEFSKVLAKVEFIANTFANERYFCDINFAI